MGLRAIARVARQSISYEITPSGVNSSQIRFHSSAGVGACFKGGPNFPGNVNQLSMYDESCIGAGPGGVPAAVLIDGNRSKVRNFSVTEITDDRIVRIRLEVTHEAIVGSGRQEDEVLETEIFLRNGT